jgi:de-etiolated-1
VYRPIWLTFSCNDECDSHDLPAKAERFDSFFKQLYSISLASSNEYICKDFFLYVERHQYGLFATSTAQNNDSSATEGAIHGVPSIEKITFHLVRYNYLDLGGMQLLLLNYATFSDLPSFTGLV